MKLSNTWQMSGLVGNTFAFFMFNGEEYVSSKVDHLLGGLIQELIEFLSSQVRTTVGLVLLTITCAGVAVLLTLRFVSTRPGEIHLLAPTGALYVTMCHNCSVTLSL